MRSSTWDQHVKKPSNERAQSHRLTLIEGVKGCITACQFTTKPIQSRMPCMLMHDMLILVRNRRDS